MTTPHDATQFPPSSTSVRPPGDTEARVQAADQAAKTEYARSAQSSVNQFVDRVGQLPRTDAPVVTNNAGTLSATVAAVRGAVEYKLRTRIDGALTWNEGPYRADPNWTVASAAPGAWTAQCRARSAAGVESEWSAESKPVVVTAAQAAKAKTEDEPKPKPKAKKAASKE
jgi:hypothetical protein